MLALPENFESYAQARKNGFLKMKELNPAPISWTSSSKRRAEPSPPIPWPGTQALWVRPWLGRS